MFRPSWIAMLIAVGSAVCASGQQPTFSTAPTQAVYEFQLNYQLPWQRWYGGPGLSLGGTMPTQGAFGYSSLNGIPLPAPLGAGVYVNSPAPHGVAMPGPTPFGPMPMLPGAALGPMIPNLGPPALMNSPTVALPQARQMPLGMPGQPGPPFPQMPPRAIPRQPAESSPAARRMSLEQQKLGDEKLRLQQWGQAYVHYRNSAELAPERPEAQFRLGLTYAALKQYASAVRAFKRSLDIDPTLPQSGETFATMFGADSKVIQTQVIPHVADWAGENLQDPDRLFVLGVLLHFAEDPRGSEIMEAALRTTGGNNDYITAFVSGPPATDARRAAPRSRRDAGLPGDDRSQLDVPPPPVPLLDAPDPIPTPDPPPT